MKLIKEFEKVVNELNVSNHIKILLKNSFKRTEKGEYFYKQIKDSIGYLYLFDMIDDTEHDILMDLVYEQLDILELFGK